MMNPNTFQVQSPVIEDDFYGRQEIIAAILDQDQFSHAWVIGARRSGKTSLLKHLAYLVSKNHEQASQYIPIYWNMEGVKDVRGLTERLIDSLYELKRSHPDKFALLQIDLVQIEQMDLEHIFQQMNRSVTEPHIKPLFLCDEVEALVEIAAQDQRIISVLRYYFQASWNKTVIAATGGLWNLREPNKDVSPFLSGFIPPYVLGSLTKEDALLLIRRKSDDSTNQVIISPAWEEEICRITNRVPFYIQLICGTIYREKPDSLDEAITISLNSLNFDVILENDLTGLNFVEIFILLQIAEHPGIVLPDLTALLRQHIEVHNIKDFIKNLQILSYIEETLEHKFYVPNDFLRIWYQQHLLNIVEKRRPSSLSEIFEHLGKVYSLQGNTEQAIESYQKVVKDKPNFGNLFELGIAYLKCHKSEEAVENLSKALQIKPDDVTVHLYLGFSYEQNGQYEKYKENVIKAFRLDIEVAFNVFDHLRRKIGEINEEKKKATIETQKKMLSFLTHTLRNTLAGAPEITNQSLRLVQEILGNRYQEKEVYDTLNNLTTLHSIFALISNMLDTYKFLVGESEQFLLKWQQEQIKTADFKFLFALVLKQTLVRILFEEQHYSQLKKFVTLQKKYSIKQIQERFLNEIVNLKLTLQNANHVLNWVHEYLPGIALSIDGENVYFDAEGIRLHFLFACISEIVYNALKYAEAVEPIQVSLFPEAGHFVFRCQNNFSQESTKKTGEKKGLGFIKELTKLVNGVEISDISTNSVFTVRLSIPKSLLL